MGRRASRAIWVWRAVVIGLLLVLLLWGRLAPWWEEGVLILVGTGVLIVAVDIIRGFALRQSIDRRR